MILLGYPFWAIGASTCSLAAGERTQDYFRLWLPLMLNGYSRVIGLLVAASYSSSPLIRYGGYTLLASPLSCGLAFLWILATRTDARTNNVDVEEA